MLEGLLWFDSDPNRKIADKINRAARRYQDRLNHKPTVCYLNTQEFDEKFSEVDGILLKPKGNILPHHYLVGIEVAGLEVR